MGISIKMTVIWIALGMVGVVIGALLLLVLVIAISSLFVDTKKVYKKHSRYYRTLLNITTIIMARLLRIRVHVNGREKLPEGRFLLVQNHRSNYDPILTWYALMKYDLAFISKEANMRIPIYGRIIRKCCFMSIDRENPRAALMTILDAAEVVSNNEASMAIYPEGTRNKGEELLPFHNGVLKIAQRAKVPVVVTSIRNADEIHKRIPWHSTDVYLDIIDVIPAETVVKTGTAVMGEQIYQQMTETYEKQKSYKPTPTKADKIWKTVKEVLGLVLLSYFFITKVLERFGGFYPLYPYFKWELFAVLGVIYLILACRCKLKNAIISLLLFAFMYKIGPAYGYLSYIFILICATVDRRKLEKICLVILTSLVSVSATLSSFGIIATGDREVTWTRGYREEWVGLIRHGLGMIHPNSAGLLIAEVVILLFMICWNKLKWWHWLVAACVDVFIFKYIDSRAAAVLLTVTLLIMLLMRFFPKFFAKKPVYIFLSLSPFLMMLFSFAISFLFGKENAFAIKMNSLSTGRIKIGWDAIQSTKITLFGHYEGYYLDNMYLWCVYCVGILYAIVMVALYVATLYKLFKEKAYCEAAVGLGYVCFSFFENLAVNPIYNPFWWSAGALLLGKAIQEREPVEIKLKELFRKKKEA